MLLQNNNRREALNLFGKSVQFLIVFLAITFFSLVVVTAPVLAQIYGLQKGDRVKLSVPSMESQDIVGMVSDVSPSVLTLSVRDSLLFIHPSIIKELAVSKGQKRATGKGALIGAGTGALLIGGIAAIAGGSSESSCSDEELFCDIGPDYSGGAAFALGAIAGALGGAAIGALIGTAVQVDRWERVPAGVAMEPISYSERWIPGSGITLRFSLNGQ